jgi:C1A family cysteine protease
MTFGLGGVRDTPDSRDHAYIPSPEILANLPKSVNLTAWLPPVYNQGQINSCHDDQTEVLTNGGFKLFSEIDGAELLATVDPATSELSFEKPSRLVRKLYIGPMVCADGTSLNFKVTPDHQMLVRKWDEAERTLSNTYKFVEAGKLGWYCGLMNRVTWVGDEVLSKTFTLPGVNHKHRPQRESLTLSMDAWLRFLGIYLAEGTVLENEGHYKIQIAASKSKEKQFVRKVLSEIGQPYLELDDRFTFDNRRLYETMDSLGLRGVHAPQKFVPEFVFHQNAENIREFLLGHWMGDGSEANQVRSHHTSSMRLADDLQRLIFLSGDETSWTSTPPQISVMTDGTVIHGNYDMHRIPVRGRKNLSIDKREQIFTESYNGFVYCAEVPTHHTLVTRRHGKILISGNCTANAIAAAIEFDEIKQGAKHVATPSRLFIYYNERAMEGKADQEAGGQLRDGIKSISSQGACAEGLWPYLKANVLVKPPKTCYSGAQRYSIEYQRMMHKLDLFRSCVASGYPFVFGIKVFESFQGDAVKKTGQVDMPYKGEKTVGLHAVLAAGYDDKSRRFLVRNSWGRAWGQDGYFTMPYEYLLDPEISHDFWTIRFVK